MAKADLTDYVHLATAIWNRRELWTCPADIAAYLRDDALIAPPAAALGWVAVADRLPVPYEKVLAFAGNPTVAHRCRLILLADRVVRPAHQPGATGWVRWPEPENEPWLDVSHWMALPEAPTGVPAEK